jgi:choline transport protein
MYFLAISFFAIGLNIFGYRFLGKWNEGARQYTNSTCTNPRGEELTRQCLAVFWSLTAWIATSAVILTTAPKTNAEFVFTQFTNETGWPDGVAWMLGLLQSALSLIGYDAITHMTEEMPRPTRDAPIAMITCVAIGGVT